MGLSFGVHDAALNFQDFAGKLTVKEVVNRLKNILHERDCYMRFERSEEGDSWYVWLLAVNKTWGYSRVGLVIIQGSFSELEAVDRRFEPKPTPPPINVDAYEDDLFV